MVKEAEKVKRINPFLPFIGFVVAVSVGVIAYFVAHPLTELIKDQLAPGEFERRLGTLTQENFEIAIALVLWLLLFAVAMFIVSAGIGLDPEEADTLVPPRPGDVKGTKAYLKKLDKVEARRAKQIKAKRAADEREKRR
jgi:hypothetical protein